MVVSFLEENYESFQVHIEDLYSIDPGEAEVIIDELREYSHSIEE